MRDKEVVICYLCNTSFEISPEELDSTEGLLFVCPDCAEDEFGPSDSECSMLDEENVEDE